MSGTDSSDFCNAKTGLVIFLILPHFELDLDVFIVSYSCNNNSYLFFAAACFDKRSLLIFLFSRVEANNTNKSFKFELNSIRVFSYSAEKSNGNFFWEITYLLIIYLKKPNSSSFSINAITSFNWLKISWYNLYFLVLSLLSSSSNLALSCIFPSTLSESSNPNSTNVLVCSEFISLNFFSNSDLKCSLTARVKLLIKIL